MRRVAIVGGSGSGKSTLATALADKIGGTPIELDVLFHGENWAPTSTPEFRRRVTEALDTDSWVVAGNYSVVMDLVHGGADTIIWLDLPRWLTIQRVIRRSLRRVIKREKLWNGNRERWRNLISRNPEVNIIVWAWTHHDAHTKRYEGFLASQFWAHADVRRLRSQRDVAQMVSSV
jgi:adenylate kinase family enzyme